MTDWKDSFIGSSVVMRVEQVRTTWVLPSLRTDADDRKNETDPNGRKYESVAKMQERPRGNSQVRST
jgi:hypothetical protein